jgi:hypothetical protein
VSKNTHITESKYIQIRAEFFNAFNHKNHFFGNTGVFDLESAAFNGGTRNPFVDVSSADFANKAPLNAVGRSIQLSVKFIF